jgi:hypothetical protein
VLVTLAKRKEARRHWAARFDRLDDEGCYFS